MENAIKDLSAKIGTLGSNWTVYTVMGSFLLYVLGYLSLRFHLTAMGVGTDLTVLDERYLFTGARFLVYFASALPSVVLILLLLGLVLYLPYCLLPSSARNRLVQWTQRLVTWATSPGRLALVGITFSVLVIQLLMRDCFELDNLLLREELPEDNRLVGWLVEGDKTAITLFFTALLVSTGLACLIVLRLLGLALEGASLWARHLLIVLVAIQGLLLPVNFGYLILDNTLPQVASLDGTTPLPRSTQAWLVWEGKDGLTFLVRSDPSSKAPRTLVTLQPRSEVKRIEILANDPILPTLYAPKPEKKP